MTFKSITKYWNMCTNTKMYLNGSLVEHVLSTVNEVKNALFTSTLSQHGWEVPKVRRRKKITIQLVLSKLLCGKIESSWAFCSSYHVCLLSKFPGEITFNVLLERYEDQPWYLPVPRSRLKLQAGPGCTSSLQTKKKKDQSDQNARQHHCQELAVTTIPLRRYFR